MSYEIEIAGDAPLRFRALPILVQEEVLDLFDELAASVSPLPSNATGSIEQHLLMYRDGSMAYSVMVTVSIDYVAAKITIQSLEFFGRMGQ